MPKEKRIIFFCPFVSATQNTPKGLVRNKRKMSAVIIGGQKVDLGDPSMVAPESVEYLVLGDTGTNLAVCPHRDPGFKTVDEKMEWRCMFWRKDRCMIQVAIDIMLEKNDSRVLGIVEKIRDDLETTDA